MRTQSKNDPEDPFAPVEQFDFEGLTPDQIRDLLAGCPDSFEHNTYSEQSEDDG